MSLPEKISAVLIALDEEARIDPALESLRWADEVLVVDGGSADRTREVSRAAGARVVERAFSGYVDQKTFALEQASFDWVLSLDADERVSPDLAAQIDSQRRAGFDALGYRVHRVTYYLDRYIRSTDWYPDRPLRLFHRAHARWAGKYVHESVRVDGPVDTLSGELLHYPYRDIEHHLTKMNRYSTLAARQMYEAGSRGRLWLALAYPPWIFFRNYVLRRGFRDGRAGLVVSALNSFYVMSKHLKLWEIERGILPSSREALSTPSPHRESPARARSSGAEPALTRKPPS